MKKLSAYFVFLLCLLSALTATAQDFYVTPDGQAPKDYNGQPIENAWSGTGTVVLTTLTDALAQAEPGQTIWVQGFEKFNWDDKDKASRNLVYTTPDKSGFVLKAGVKLYGGFKGNETALEQRVTSGEAFKFAYCSILVGDIGWNDVVDAIDLISSANVTRLDNADHVVTMTLDNSTSDNKNDDVSVLNGFTITGGQASSYGGGVYVEGGAQYSCAYRIERCFLFNNYATQQGGGIYADVNAGKITPNASFVNQCVVYNNVAGQMGEVTNSGGGVYIAGSGKVVNSTVFNNEHGGVRISPEAGVLNSTVVRNTGGGVDLTVAGGSNDDAKVVNTVIWGNSMLFNEFTPGFRSSAYHEVTDEVGDGVDAYGNVYVGKKNNDPSQASPFFASPSLRVSFDHEFKLSNTIYPLWSWQPLEGSAFINRGDIDAYLSNVYGENSLDGISRTDGDAIDVGAYEFHHVKADRILRVAEGGDDSNDGSSWDKAYRNVQTAIDKLASDGRGGEVWVKAGTYQPTVYMSGSSSDRSAAFVMKDGVSVYGGFGGTESAKSERRKEAGAIMPWQYEAKTVFVGSGYETDGGCVYNETDRKWNINGSQSNHVVWFAEKDGTAFSTVTVLDGVTVKGGSAQESNGTEENFFGDRGAGVYMAANAYMTNCVVAENAAGKMGGGVYLYGGRVIGSLLYNNEGYSGGAVYIDNSGIVLRSMLTNNTGFDGAGVYMLSDTPWEDGFMHPEFQIISTSVVSNNTSRHNGAVFCNGGGVMLQTTMTYNVSTGTIDLSDSESAQTGGLYVNGYGLSVNSVIWNNTIKGINVPMYASNPAVDKVRFYNTAVSGMNNAIWNNTLQQDLTALGEANSNESVITPEFDPDGMPAEAGVDGGLKEVEYYWQPLDGSNLRFVGLEFERFPEEVLLDPELDIKGTLFEQKPSVGAMKVEEVPLVPETDGNVLRLYVDVNSTSREDDGSSWDKAYRSLNDAIEYFAGRSEAEAAGKTFEILVHEGNLYPRYTHVNLDPRSATINILKTPAHLVIKGGYHVEGGTVERNPLEFRSVIDGNHKRNAIEDGLFHCITVADDADVEIDGFHVVGGYAVQATYRSGAGLRAKGGSKVTVRNTVFENHTAAEAAAIWADESCTLRLVNCVVNNNTNTENTDQPVVVGGNLQMDYVTVVNNVGAAPQGDYATSFSAGNTAPVHDTHPALQTLSADGAKNFSNPTNNQGATLNFDTYLGGHPEFRPQTASADAAVLINKAASVQDVTEDISGRGRDLGGMPDLGAYEANLPESGTVLYVTATGAGNMDGSSWENAIAGNQVYDFEDKKRAGTGVFTTDTEYIGFIDDDSPYGETSGASKLFFEHMGEEGVINGTAISNVNYTTASHDGVTHVTGASGINIRNRRYERYIGGLQYAVERAAASAEGGKPMQVWVAGGTYNDYKGFVIRDKVEVLGGFPASGTPGVDDRHPLLSQYIPANEEAEGLDKALYETILQIQETDPTTNASSLPGRTRKPVLFQPDVCLPTKSPSNRESSFSYWAWEWEYSFPFGHYEWVNNGYGNSVPGADATTSNTYRWNLPESQQNGIYEEYTGATWDGFTIRHGFYTDYKANRDGGAGVRMFRGVTLQNCVVTENYINGHDEAGRGGGIYCDGNNSKVVNCFVLNNSANSDESYGGGMYMILGTSYNTLVANNYAKSNGGGVFIEDAMFYNNTVAYNRSSGTGGLHQWTASSGTETTLKLYNTVFYGNENRAVDVENANNFNGAWNCFVQTTTALDEAVQGKIQQSQIGTDLASPFASAQAQAENNFRLNADTWCLNKGTENFGNDYLGEPVELPATDVDFTDRIKDCTVDIGAYERRNEDVVEPDADGVYYVTFNGNGSAKASSPDNAACAMKLQEVLNAAGRRAAQGYTAIVKIAGYEGGASVYHPNTLVNPNDPKSYAYVIPEGVTVMGGYNEGSYVNGEYQNDGNWAQDNRNATQYMTVLSAISDETGGRQAVNGYHVVQFGSDGVSALDKTAILDGVYLQDGLATSSAGSGNPNTRGGGAIVPKGAHVRNCVVRNNEAVDGGGLYVLPGGMVSGCGIMQNKADNGGGLYLSDEGGAVESSRAHVFSSTIVENEAATVGGGVYLKPGSAMAVNTVVWGNTAPSDKNISGVTDAKYKDDLLGTISPDENDKGGFYPFNSSYVETYELPGNFQNQSMTPEKGSYFMDFYLPRPFSVLVKGGARTALQRALESNGSAVSPYDMQGILRVQQYSSGADLERIDAGAYAREGGSMRIPENEGEVIKRIFVSRLANTPLGEGEDEGFVKGRSFHTALSSLPEALDYIDRVRALDFGGEIEFEIWLAEGTYKPRNERADASTEGDDPSHRQNSFVLPKGVKIFGGFSGEELYSYKLPTLENLGEPLEDLYDADDNKIQTILDGRESGDINSNGIHEPWEMRYQTVLSGEVNLSPTEKHVYHVLYSELKEQSENLGGVTLDGLTVMGGETYHVLKGHDELGRGGGIYTVEVDYTLVRCRLLENKAVRGGAIYALNADVTSVDSYFSGNGTVDDATVDPAAVEQDGTNVRGGAVYLAGRGTTPYSLKAVNTLWANNGTDAGTSDNPSWGGAIALGGTAVVDLMNNTFVRNKAGQYAAVYVPEGSTGNKIVNTAVWGNEGEGVPLNIAADEISYSACDTDFGGGQNNIVLGTDNNAVNGPRFDEPSAVAGTEGKMASAKWEPISISVLVDAGNGVMSKDDVNISGAYNEWMEAYAPAYKDLYMADIARYAGPLDATGQPMDKKIDIGVFEYQYPQRMSALDVVYVDMTESGKRDGSSWDNATSDLRGALNAMANATGSQQTPPITDKAVYIKGGTYTMGNSLMTGDIAYQITMSGVENTHVSSLTVNGSYNEAGVQDFSQPTVLTDVTGSGKTTLLNVSTNGKPVNISGIAFHDAKTGLQVGDGNGGELTVKNSAFRKTETGMSVTGSGNDVLIANALFADGETGLYIANNNGVTVVNATFAQNSVAAVSGISTGEVFNSAAWRTGTVGFVEDNGYNNKNNKVFVAGHDDNTDLENGPNFVDPDNVDLLKRDYNIRPGFTLLNKGDESVYTEKVGVEPAGDWDLGGTRRSIGESIDIGAYEYGSELNQYIYVKQSVAGSDNSGDSWDNAMGDLQGAVDLATVYAETSGADANGYVFVHQNVKNAGLLRLTHGGVKVYGGMDAGTVTDANPVGEVLKARNGLLETAEKSALKGGVTVSGGSVVDGFEVSGTASVSGGGMLSTSILTAGTQMTVGAEGILYNTLADGAAVTGDGKAVNVTSTGSMDLTSKYKVVENAVPCGHVTDAYWQYQLGEKSAHIDNADSDAETRICMWSVGHDKDMAGNSRVRGNVDNGCFETWNITDLAGTVTAEDYPHGKSVVYVREGNELRLKRDYTEAAPFNPGFLLLEHGAGLWGGGKQVALTNFAVERKLTETNGCKDLVAMPFVLQDLKVYDGQGGIMPDEQLSGMKIFQYDGKTRAAYGYKFSDDKGAWKETENMNSVTEGLLFESEQPVTLRFSGFDYQENGQPKNVALKKYNFNSPWSSPADTGDKFTHKENMSWNLFGSPYLCTMNYEDMEYGRVVYGYANNGYYTQNTWNEDAVVTGSIPAGSAVFTQTATLKEQETFAVNLRAEEIQNQAARSTNLAVYIAPAVDKRGAETAGIYDELQLEAVPTEEAVTEFDLARDGVKWMNGNREPEIFAARDGGRYSLLSAIDKEGTTKVGVSLPEAGNYIVGIPEDIGAEDYEYVVLTDAVANKAVDLKEGAYVFSAAEAGDFDGRFTLTFHKTGGEYNGRIFVKSGWGEATVVGVNEGDNVTVFTVDGKAVANSEASGSEVRFVLAKGAYLFVVKGAGGNDAVVKSVVR